MQLLDFPEKPMKLDPTAFIADQELTEALGRIAEPVHCKEDHVLFQQGDDPAGLYILARGNAVLSMSSPSGEEVLSTEAVPGSLLGLPGLIGNEPYSLTAIGRKGAELGFVARQDFAALMMSDPRLSLKVLQVLAAEVRAARQAIFEL
jgi:CRP-like cAMP-binding protein